MTKLPLRTVVMNVVGTAAAALAVRGDKLIIELTETVGKLTVVVEALGVSVTPPPVAV